MKATKAALGFRVKSGWAVSILINGSIQSPRLCESVVIDLCDPRDPETRQPYHAAMGKLETSAAKLKRRTQSVRRATERSISDLLKRCADNGYAIHGAGLVVGSVIDPDSIANPHIRAHAAEGRLFRTALQAGREANESKLSEQLCVGVSAVKIEQSKKRIRKTGNFQTGLTGFLIFLIPV